MQFGIDAVAGVIPRGLTFQGGGPFEGSKAPTMAQQECPICLEDFGVLEIEGGVGIVHLSCLHPVCQMCYDAMVDHLPPGKASLTCGLCRAEHSLSAADLKKKAIAAEPSGSSVDVGDNATSGRNANLDSALNRMFSSLGVQRAVVHSDIIVAGFRQTAEIDETGFFIGDTYATLIQSQRQSRQSNQLLQTLDPTLLGRGRTLKDDITTPTQVVTVDELISLLVCSTRETDFARNQFVREILTTYVEKGIDGGTSLSSDSGYTSTKSEINRYLYQFLRRIKVRAKQRENIARLNNGQRREGDDHLMVELQILRCIFRRFVLVARLGPTVNRGFSHNFAEDSDVRSLLLNLSDAMFEATFVWNVKRYNPLGASAPFFQTLVAKMDLRTQKHGAPRKDEIKRTYQGIERKQEAVRGSEHGAIRAPMLRAVGDTREIGMGSKPLVCDTISVPPQQYRHGAGRRDVYHEGTTGGPWLFGFETDRQLDHACAVCGEEALLNPAMFSETTTQTDAERMPKNQLRNGWLLWHLRGKWVKADESRCHSLMVQQICVLGILESPYEQPNTAHVRSLFFSLSLTHFFSSLSLCVCVVVPVLSL